MANAGNHQNLGSVAKSPSFESLAEKSKQDGNYTSIDQLSKIVGVIAEEVSDSRHSIGSFIIISQRSIDVFLLQHPPP